jgi:hypothetical protein
MNKNALKKILEHPDRDEIISKLVIGIPPKDIYEFLSGKYTNVVERKFVISEKLIKAFQDNYLDIYNTIYEDIVKVKSSGSVEEKLELAIRNNSSYRSVMLKTANNELDIREMITNLCKAIESRLAQVFDEIQEDPRNINTRVDRLLIDYTEVLGNILEKYYKFTELPVNQVVQHNVTLQVVDQHISVFHDVIREVLSQMDLETSLYFMEVFNDKMAKLKPPGEKEIPNTDIRLAEAKLLNETINKKLNGQSHEQI